MTHPRRNARLLGYTDLERQSIGKSLYTAHLGRSIRRVMYREWLKVFVRILRPYSIHFLLFLSTISTGLVF